MYSNRCAIKNNTIIVDPEILSGEPVFKGTRVPIRNLFDYIETGENLETFLEDFPSVTKEQAIGLLESAEELLIENSMTK